MRYFIEKNKKRLFGFWVGGLVVVGLAIYTMLGYLLLGERAVINHAWVLNSRFENQEPFFALTRKSGALFFKRVRRFRPHGGH